MLYLEQDCSLRRAQQLARLQSELVREEAARVAVDGEGLGLPSEAVQSGHQERAQTLAKRMLDDERGEPRDQNVTDG
jgi:hypothetical protein